MSPNKETVNEIITQSSDVLMQIVEEELTRTLGAKIAENILTPSGSTKRKINRVESFTNILHAYLGTDALPIERIILKRLYSTLGLTLEYKKGYCFLDYIDEIASIQTALA